MSTQQYVIHHNGDSEPFSDRDEFEMMVDLLNRKGEEFEVETPDAAGSHDKETDGGQTVVENGSEQPEHDAEPVQAEVVETTSDPMPKVSETEQTAREIISALEQTDLDELVWNPHADPSTVPYNPRTLVHNTITPSAKAFDLFASIIEAATDIQYSVVEWDFEETESQYRCDVIIEKQAGETTKRLVGFKTELKENAGESAWRERVYSKARRNALKQDISPTWIKALLDRYREVQR